MHGYDVVPTNLNGVKGHQNSRTMMVLTWDACLNIKADLLARDYLDAMAQL